MLCYLYILPIQAEILPERVTPNKTEKYKLYFEQEIKNLTTLLKEQNYANSLVSLTKIENKIRTQQNNIIASFFPTNFNNMKIANQKSFNNSDFGPINHGIVFSQRYTDKQGRYLEINIINDPHSIKDYEDLLSNPSLVASLKNTEIIKNNEHTSLQTANINNKHFEQNIILKSNLLLTLIEIGFTQETLFTSFIAESKISDLEEYFLK